MVITGAFTPGVGGLEGIKIYRENWSSCRIISMSSGFDEEMSSSLTLQAAMKSGLDGILKIPFTGDDLTRLVGDLCFSFIPICNGRAVCLACRHAPS